MTKNWLFAIPVKGPYLVLKFKVFIEVFSTIFTFTVRLFLLLFLDNNSLFNKYK